VIVQLDRPLLFDGERVTVEIIDRETNTVVMDRTVRIRKPPTFSFAPDGTGVVSNESAPGSPDANVSVDPDLPNVSIDDPPDTNPSDDDSGDSSDGGDTSGDTSTGDSGDGGDTSGDASTGDGTNKPPGGAFVNEPTCGCTVYNDNDETVEDSSVQDLGNLVDADVGDNNIPGQEDRQGTQLGDDDDNRSGGRDDDDNDGGSSGGSSDPPDDHENSGDDTTGTGAGGGVV